MATEKRTGGCHCKNVRYETEIDLSKAAIECNCSYCQMKGTLLVFVPGNLLTVTKGEDELTKYRFNTNVIEHSFCKTCGVQCFGRAEMEGGPGAMVNVRTIDDIDLAAIERMPFDGRSR